MFEARFQSFDDPERAANRAPGAGAARRAGKARPRRASSCRAPTAIRTNTCRRSEERLAWLTGFTGSAGCAVVLADHAALFVDGRYTLQARDQVDTAVFAIVPSAETSPEQWLEANLPTDAKLGYDPWLHTVDGAERLARACANAGATLVADRAQSDRRDSGPTGRRRRSAR